MQKYNIVLPTWHSMYTPMPLTSVLLTLAVTLAATSSLAVFPVMVHQFRWMALFISPAQFSYWWLPWLLRQNLGRSSYVHKKPKSSILSLKNLIIHNHQLPSTLTTPLLSALSITPSSNIDHALWKWCISGSLMVKPNNSFNSIINLAERTWATTLPKNHSADIHQHVCPYYVCIENSPAFFPWAAKPSSWQGCLETLADPYKGRNPLPRVPNY